MAQRAKLRVRGHVICAGATQNGERGASQPARASAAPSAPPDAAPAEETSVVIDDDALGPPHETPRARVLAVTPREAASPYAHPMAVPGGYALWEDALRHLGRRTRWSEPSVEVSVFTLGSEDSSWLPEPIEPFAKAAADADMVLFVGVHDLRSARFLIRNTSHIPTCLAFKSCSELERQSRLLFQPQSALLDQALRRVPFSNASKDAKLLQEAHELYSRKTPNDFVYMLLRMLDKCVTPLESVAESDVSSLSVASCCLRNCWKASAQCALDENCRKAFQCLDNCGLNDQVCSYRCIVSYESQKFQEFSLCNLQKHNCLGNKAQRPKYPDVQPLTEWRGQALTHEAAEEIFEGWLVQKPWSWMVVCGQNPAYDIFPCQHQIFYYGKGGKSFWYDPVFKAITLDGRETWRRRHYRVKRGEQPGTFFFSVLDNGVTSNEYWRIVDVREDLSWAVFYYTGAASAAGQSYSGAVFVTADGQWPEEDEIPRVEQALAKCGIKFWEMYEVDNRCCDGSDSAGEPPLGSLPG